MRPLVAVLIVLSLTGCASLPVSGPVRIGPDLSTNNDAESFYYSPSVPTDGASQTEILTGFIAAGTGPQNDYAVAREYLSESIRSTWNPNQEVLIQRATPKVIIGEDNSAELELDVSARIDVDGKYESLPVGSGRILDFEFVLENQQWRLSKVPDATVLIRPVFDVVFREYSIYFLDRQKRNLVPELRWFPATPATGTRLVNALLRGPSAWLRPAVVSSIPSGTRLSIDAVTVEDRVALVDLTARALVATRLDRQLMKAQLDATLSQLINIESVAVSIERSRQEITEANLDLQATGSKSLIALSDKGLEGISTPDTSFFRPAEDFFALNPTNLFALSKQSGSLAVASPAGVVRTSASDPGAEVELIDGRTQIVALEYDHQDYLWSINRSRGSDIFATGLDGERYRVLAAWLNQESIRGFALSPEGSRAVLLVQGAQKNRVLLTSVVRSQAGVPLELSNPVEIATEISNPSYLSWISDTGVAVLSKSGDFSNAYLVDIGGTSRMITSVTGARAIVSAGPSGQLYLLADSGELYSFTGSTWSLLRGGISALTVVD